MMDSRSQPVDDPGANSFTGTEGMETLDMAGHLIRRLHQQSTQTFVQRVQDAGFDLTPVQFAALDAIHAHPARDQSFVAELIGYDRATIGGVIDRLQKKGWIRRVVSEQDRRARRLTLTPKGRRVRSALQPIVRDLQKDILKPLNDADCQCFLDLIRKLVWRDDASGASTPMGDALSPPVNRAGSRVPT